MHESAENIVLAMDDQDQEKKASIVSPIFFIFGTNIICIFAGFCLLNWRSYKHKRQNDSELNYIFKGKFVNFWRILETLISDMK